MAVGADQRVGEDQPVAAMHAGGEVFEVDLVHDADSRGHDLEAVEGLHAPLHEGIALAIAPEFELHVEVERLRGAVVVDHHRVIDDQVDRHQRFDASRRASFGNGGIAHGGEVGEQRHAGEVLQDDAGDDEGDLLAARRVRLPAGEFADVRLGHRDPVDMAQQAFEDDTQRDRQAAGIGKAGGGQRRQGVVVSGVGRQRAAGGGETGHAAILGGGEVCW